MPRDIKLETDYADFSGNIGLQNKPTSWKRRLLSPWGLLLTRNGKGKIRFEDTELPILPRQLLIYKPNYKYEFSCEGEWSYIWFHYPLRDHLIEGMIFDEILPGLGCFTFDAREYRKVLFLLLEACDLEQRRPPGWYQLALISVENVLLRAINFVHGSHRRNRDRIRKITKLLTEHPEKNIAEIAVKCGISEPLLYALFQQEMGCPPRRYRELYLLRRAQRLLLYSSLSFTEIAAELGFCDQFYFSNRFKKNFGCSPSEFRKNGFIS